jgi:hypothetical protein
MKKYLKGQVIHSMNLQSNLLKLINKQNFLPLLEDLVGEVQVIGCQWREIQKEVLIFLHRR